MSLAMQSEEHKFKQAIRLSYISKLQIIFYVEHGYLKCNKTSTSLRIVVTRDNYELTNIQRYQVFLNANKKHIIVCLYSENSIVM
jgi:hypothetical protein